MFFFVGLLPLRIMILIMIPCYYDHYLFRYLPPSPSDCEFCGAGVLSYLALCSQHLALGWAHRKCLIRLSDWMEDEDVPKLGKSWHSCMAERSPKAGLKKQLQNDPEAPCPIR